MCTMQTRFFLLLLCSSISAGTLCAQSAGEIGGYLDYLATENFPPQGESLYEHLLHARLNTKWYATENLTGVLELRSRFYYGSLVRSTPGFADALKNTTGSVNLGTYLWNRTSSVGYAEVDRAYADWNQEQFEATLGRQRIAWGTNLVWNPIDLFNPLSILDFDYAERPATDALRLQYYTGAVSKIELAVKPGTVSTRAITAGQWSTNRWNYDFHILAGKRGDSWFGGAAWVGDIEGGGFRGEVLTSEIPGELRNSARSTMISAALSGDYTFSNSFYLHGEGLYNSEGVTSRAALSRLRSTELGLLSPARFSVYAEAAYDLTPLVRLTLFGLVNPLDASRVIVPSVSWSALTNLDLMALAMFFEGDPLTEFGGYGTTLFLRAKWSY